MPTPTPSPVPTGSATETTLPFWDRFLTSGGFAGCMAVVAAVIAATLTWVQFRHSRRKAEEDRWWDTLTWVYDRTIVEQGKKAPLPQFVTFSMLSALYASIKEKKNEKIREGTIASITRMFQTVDEAGAEDDSDATSSTSGEWIPVTDPAAMDALDELRFQVADPAALGLEARGYEHEASLAMQRVVGQLEDVSFETLSSGDAIDGKVFQGQRLVCYVEFKWIWHAETIRPWAELLLMLNRALRRLLDTTESPVIYVSNQAFDERPSHARKNDALKKLRPVQWRDQGDDGALLSVLQSMLQADKPGSRSRDAPSNLP